MPQLQNAKLDKVNIPLSGFDSSKCSFEAFQLTGLQIQHWHDAD
jgi:hypothetical protein